VNCQLYEQRDLIYSSGLSSDSAEETEKKHTYSSNSAVRDMNNRKNFTRYLPALFDKCFLTLAVTTDVHKQYTTAYPLLPAGKIRCFLLANSAITFI
jgi:hypothetical protein